MKSNKLHIYSICAVLSLGVIPSVFALQTANAREDNPSSNAEQSVREEVRSVAQEAREATQQEREAAREQAERMRNEAKQERTDGREASKVAKLDAKKLELCEKRESKITASMQRSSTQGVNQLEVFKKIADRTKAFYEDKGYSVENYDSLIADMDTAYVNAKESVETIKPTDPFDCSGDNPKVALTAFSTAHKAKTAALKEYKTAVKNFILAIKSAQSVTDDTTEDSSEVEDDTDTQTESPEVEAR